MNRYTFLSRTFQATALNADFNTDLSRCSSKVIGVGGAVYSQFGPLRDEKKGLWINKQIKQ